MFRFYLTLINLNSCIGLTLGGALQLSHGFALPAPSRPHCRPPGRLALLLRLTPEKPAESSKAFCPQIQSQGVTERELESRPLDCVVPTAGQERVLLHVVVSETDENVRRPVQVPWPVWNCPQ